MRFGFLLGLLLVLMTGSLIAQTRKISHRSHSGTLLSFAMFLEEDHLGDGPGMREPYVPYVVDPFIARIRKHYEKYAKNAPSKNEPKAEMPSSEPNAPAPDSAQGSKQAPSSEQSGQKEPMPQATVQDLDPSPTSAGNPNVSVAIPRPDFLVKAKPEAQPKAASSTDGPQQSSMWLLFALLAFPVAPVVFLLSFRAKGQPS